MVSNPVVCGGQHHHHVDGKCQPGKLCLSPNGEMEAEQMAEAFINDSNLAVNEVGVHSFNKKWVLNDNLEEAKKMDFQGYERYLFLGGAKLAFNKCNFYFLGFKRHKNMQI